MTGISESLIHPSAGTGGVIAVMGYAVVFFGIVLLLMVVAAMGKAMAGRREKAASAEAPAPAATAAPAPAPAPAAPAAPAKGTAGRLKLYDTDPRDAAMVMAIVAYRLGKPVNELRFRSIKEVKEK